MKTDYLIIGAGCAGLSLAVNLIACGMSDRQITLIDPRTTFPRDRTWCFWNVCQHEFEETVSHSWNQWRVIGPDQETICHSLQYAYQHIAADDFYTNALTRLRQQPNVDLQLGQKVCGLTDQNGHVCAETSVGIIRAEYVFDSRPLRKLPARNGVDEVCLLQHFAGAQVKTHRPIFAPETATLMDFQTHQQHGIHFMYVLPYSPCEALIETTYFSEQPRSFGAYERDIQTYFTQTYGGVAYTVSHQEKGIIPMTTAPFPVQPSPHVYAIGLAGGLAKPSTGYAFLAIQQLSAQLAHQLQAGDPPAPHPPRSAISVFLDRVFLSHLRRSPTSAGQLFSRLFSRVKPNALVRFLSDTGSLSDTLQVVRAMPKAALTLEAVRSWKLWLHS